MAKAAKKKQKTSSQEANQRRHSRATRGSNSTNRPIIWEHRRMKTKQGFVDDIVEYPSNTMWDWSLIYDAVTDPYTEKTKLIRKKSDKQKPLYEPFDTLLENWEDGLRSYAFHNSAEIHRNQLPDGRYEYTVWKLAWNRLKGEDEKKVLLTVTSQQNCHFGKKKKFRKKKNRG